MSDDNLPATLLDQIRNEDLIVVIDVHRANCRQPSCPVLTAMVLRAETRNTYKEQQL